MERLIAFDSVRQQLLAQCPAIDEMEEAPLDAVAGRRLGVDVVATEAHPPAALAAADGVAVRAEDSVGASPYNPLPLSAGGSAVEPGDALPAGADAVAPWETVEAAGDSWMLLAEVDAGQGVCRAGQLLRAGTTALAAGRRLKAADLALLAGLGHTSVTLRRRPVVQVLYLRSEVEAERLRLLLHPPLAADGAVLHERTLGAADELASCLVEAAAAADDLVLVVGGTGEGPSGVAPEAVARAGTLHAHQIAVRPGRAAGLGVVGGTAVLLVPPEPVAACAIADLLAGPAIRSLGGGAAGLPHRTWTGPLARKLVSSLGEVGYLRATIDGEEIRPQPTGTDLDLPALSRTDGFILVDPDSEGHPPGTAVTLYRDRC